MAKNESVNGVRFANLAQPNYLHVSQLQLAHAEAG